MSVITQEQVEDICTKLKLEWDEKVIESGHNESMFIVLDNTGFVSNFMYYYQVAKEHVESLGLIMPEIIKGVTVNIKED
tara:strand:+ start:84351 stop:84587 length:237 start_codon:yes stop_codon:yes gene_type:complete